MSEKMYVKHLQLVLCFLLIFKKKKIEERKEERGEVFLEWSEWLSLWEELSGKHLARKDLPLSKQHTTQILCGIGMSGTDTH